jgi:hypothetical protein
MLPLSGQSEKARRMGLNPRPAATRFPPLAAGIASNGYFSHTQRFRPWILQRMTTGHGR